MRYSTKQLAELAGISRRTLHYYDEIGLLKPSVVGQNKYRYYDEENMFRLQQILFFRELDFSLEEIQTIIDAPDFDQLTALQTHRIALEKRSQRLNNLIQTIDKTILFLKGQFEMSSKDLFSEFSDEQQEAFYEEARQKYDSKIVEESNRRWHSYSQAQKEAYKAESEAMYGDLVLHMHKGHDSAEVQGIVGQWHDQLRIFYEPSVEMMVGLANMYVEDERFAAFYQKMHPEMPRFFREAILYYCGELGEVNNEH